MEQNQNAYITLEVNLKLTMRDYRLVMRIKRTWIIAIFIGAIQLLTWFLRED
ncbi:MAG: hypothetical protein AB7G93_01010 [Bdellovibrionales bacterium]